MPPPQEQAARNGAQVWLNKLCLAITRAILAISVILATWLLITDLPKPAEVYVIFFLFFLLSSYDLPGI